MTNRLAHETSPYLLQHQHHPVDWYPWGEEALQKARNEDKPILLSIGYSSCHWCHVMAHESFENQEIAQLMNQHFVNIKVDREERPDLDQIYQNVAQAMTRGGGWPLTVFLTPDLKPFFGGTYFPPEDRYGRPGFPRVLQALAEAYRSDRDSVLENAQRLIQYISRVEGVEKGEFHLPQRKDLESIVNSLLDQVDWVHGGLGGAPKFPNPMVFDFLWRWSMSCDDDRARQAVRLSLREMAAGGIYDQLGGGFHRYSVDATWSVPHFEKMLYDNGLLLKLYSQVLLTGSQFLDTSEKVLYRRVIQQTVEYLRREMLSSDGLFYSAQDADSEGEEGRFFVWDDQDLSEVLTDNERVVFKRSFGVTEQGNFEHGKTVLFQSETLEEIAQDLNLKLQDLTSCFESACEKVFQARIKRVAPETDDKVLTSWNALMISGLVWASQAMQSLGDVQWAQECLDLAKKAFDSLIIHVSLPTKEFRLASTYQAGSPKHAAYLDDYAFLARAALDLSRVETDQRQVKRYVECAQKAINTVLQRFRDDQAPGFFFTSDDHEELIQRPKTIFDQAIPSGTSVVLECLGVLAELDEVSFGVSSRKELERQIGFSFAPIQKSPYGCGQYLSSVLQYQMGVVALSGTQASRFCLHPHVVQKPSNPDDFTEIMACHQGVCTSPFGDHVQLEYWLESKLRVLT